MIAGSQHFLPCSLQVGAAAGAAAGLLSARATSEGTYAAPNPTAAESDRPNMIFRCDIERLLLRRAGPYHSHSPRTPVDTPVGSM